MGNKQIYKLSSKIEFSQQRFPNFQKRQKLCKFKAGRENSKRLKSTAERKLLRLGNAWWRPLSWKQEILNPRLMSFLFYYIWLKNFSFIPLRGERGNLIILMVLFSLRLIPHTVAGIISNLTFSEMYLSYFPPSSWNSICYFSPTSDAKHSRHPGKQNRAKNKRASFVNTCASRHIALIAKTPDDKAAKRQRCYKL